jgi:hypothetical protein
MNIYKNTVKLLLAAGAVGVMAVPLLAFADDGGDHGDEEVDRGKVNKEISKEIRMERRVMREELKQQHDVLREEINTERKDLRADINSKRDAFREESKGLEPEERSLERSLLHKEFEAQREILRNTVMEKREIFKDAKQSRMDAFKERLGELKAGRIEAFFAQMVRRMEAAIDRLEKLADRMATRLDKFEDSGKDVADFRIGLDMARDLLVAAETSLDEAKEAFNDMSLSENYKTAFQEVKRLVRDVAAKIKDAHKALVDVINSIKG